MCHFCSAYLPTRSPLWPPADDSRSALNSATTDGERTRHARGTLGYWSPRLRSQLLSHRTAPNSASLFRRRACDLDVMDRNRTLAPHKCQQDRPAHAGRTAANQPHYACHVHDEPFTESE